MKVECSYTEDSWSSYPDKFYCCNVTHKQISDEGELKFIGNHLRRKTSNDVTYIYFYECTMSKLPQGLSNFFPNLKIILVYNSKLKTISKNDLNFHKQLKIFDFSCTDIEFVPGDLFDDSKEIEWIRFNGNKNLKIIEPNLLDNLQNLKYVWIENSSNYDIKFAAFPDNKTNATLQDVKIHLTEKFFALDSKIVKDFIMKFEHPVEELKTYMKGIKKTETILKMKSEILESAIEVEFQNHRESVQNFQKQIGNLTKQIQKGLFGDLKAFIQDETFKDFKIIIDDREFPVHKFLLAARSPTLAEILRNNPEVENLNLVDISVETFEEILKFLYTDELPREDGTNFLHLFAAAGKLKIAELIDIAAEKILNQIGTLNALDVFYLVNRYKHDELIQKSFEKVKKKYLKIEFKDEWAKNPEKMSKVIEAFKKKEEAMRKLESEFEDILTED